MTTKNNFWKLTDSREINSKKDLIELLEASSSVANVSYMPRFLQNSGDIKKSHFLNKTFKRVKFSHTCFSDIIFRNCVFEDCLFIGTRIIHCEFHNCEFIRTNTYKISISKTYIDPKSFRNCLNPREHQNLGVHLYQILLQNSREREQLEFERDAQFFFLRWKRFQIAYEIKSLITEGEKERFSKTFVKSLEYLHRWISEKFFGSGIRLSIYFRTVAIAISGFTILNFFCRDQFGLERHSEPVSSSMEIIYYTLVSFTTLGYGDIVPSTATGQFFASVQTLCGFFLLALLVSVLSKRVFP